MENRADGKLRILYVRDIMQPRDTPERAITMAELLSKLGALGLSADRKCIYDDLNQLTRYGMTIAQTCRGRFCRYYVDRGVKR